MSLIDGTINYGNIDSCGIAPCKKGGKQELQSKEISIKSNIYLRNYLLGEKEERNKHSMFNDTNILLIRVGGNIIEKVLEKILVFRTVIVILRDQRVVHS